MLREIVLDTETTGLDANKGDRLIEIGCVELLNRIPTGNEYHQFINPEDRSVHPEAEAIHGITDDFLSDKPTFREIVGAFLDFVGDGDLIIHNASFDMGFINMELTRLKQAPMSANRVVDTLALARRKHPAGPNTLDALCKRYGIDNSQRIKHGALMDAELLAEVYIELLGARQAGLDLSRSEQDSASIQVVTASIARQRPKPLEPRLTPENIVQHREFCKSLGQPALWNKYYDDPDDATVDDAS